MKAPMPADEWQRLQALARYAILDTLPEPAFDHLTALTADVFGARLAVLNFVDEARQWGKSCVGIDDTEAGRDVSFCAWTILSDDVHVISDATKDARFTNNPMVLGEPHIRFYAGAPLVTPDGYRIGSLCITDDRPRDFGARDARRLQAFAKLAMHELEARLGLIEAERRGERLQAQHAQAQQRASIADVLIAAHDLLSLSVPAEDVVRHAATLLARVLPADAVGLVHVRADEARGEPLYAAAPDHALAAELGRAWRRAQGPTAFDVASRGGAAYTTSPDGCGRFAWLSVGERRDAHVVLVAARGADLDWSGDERATLQRAAYALGTVLAVTARHATLLREAHRDPLTNVENRRALQSAWATLPRTFGLAVLDLDHFKTVNDTLGHARGDDVLRVFSAALVAAVPPDARVFRLGGDEFAVLLEGADDADAWRDLVTRAVRAGVEALDAEGFTGVDASFGVALGAEVRAPVDALGVADARMYEHKRCKPEARGVKDTLNRALPPEAPREPTSAHDVLRVVVDGQEARFAGRRARLSPKEAALLTVLASDPERLFSREELGRLAWPDGTEPLGGTVDVHLTNVRKKLASLSPALRIRAVRGVGYGLTVDVADPAVLHGEDARAEVSRA